MVFGCGVRKAISEVELRGMTASFSITGRNAASAVSPSFAVIGISLVLWVVSCCCRVPTVWAARVSGQASTSE